MSDIFLQFQTQVWDYYHDHGRDLPWRLPESNGVFDPYKILVSELMLQQTQVARVIQKFNEFIVAYPTVQSLANSSLGDVLRLWQGLGYNRRAKFLHESAKKIVELGAFPSDDVGLQSLPGVGKNTAGAILAYAYNQPAIFIETNVRAVYIHHFFSEQDLVDDKQIQELLEQTIDHEHPREFYWALMDYGSQLKREGVTPNRSAHYKKQSPLKGSVREVRGQILSILSTGDTTMAHLEDRYGDDERFPSALSGLVADGLVMIHDDDIYLTK